MKNPITLPRLTARLLVMVSFATLLSAASFQVALAQTAPNLGAALGFSVLGGTAVTCTDSVVTGFVGLFPGTAFTNTRCTFAGGTPPATDGAAIQARTAFLSAYDALAAVSCGQTLTGTLAGVTLAPGVYCFDAAATLTGTLTLNGQGNSNAVWIFKIGAALTGTNFTVVMANGAQPCNVFWAPSAAATMTDSAFKGNILAGGATGSITLTRGAVAGRALANVAVTMTGNSVIGCTTLAAPPPAPQPCVPDDDDDDKDKKDHKKGREHHRDRD
jgi:ice-binding like protein